MFFGNVWTTFVGLYPPIAPSAAAFFFTSSVCVNSTKPGPNAVSELETRAVADFLYDRANVFAVLCFALQDNLFHPWKADPGKDKQKVRTTIL